MRTSRSDHSMCWLGHSEAQVIITLPFQRPDLSRWIDGVDALAYALVMERTLNQDLLALVGMAMTAQDPHVSI